MATYIWKRRGRFTLAMAAIIAFSVLAIDLRIARPALATSGGDPYSVPLAVNASMLPHTFETTITAEGATVDIGNGVMANMLTFNGQVPGPEIRVNVGDTVIVHYKNMLGHPSAIHWHGIELDNESDGTPLTQNMVNSGGQYLYKFKVSRPGIFWYHPHHHSSTNQVFKGLYGTLIVTDPNEAALQAAGTIPMPGQTLTMVLSDTTICKTMGSNDTTTFDTTLPWVGNPGGVGPVGDQPNPTPPKSLCQSAADGGNARDEDGTPRSTYPAGDVPNIQGNSDTATSGGGPVNEGQIVLTNGKNVGSRGGTPNAPGALSGSAQTHIVQAGQGIRLQLVNSSAVRFFRLRLTTATGTMVPLVRIGGQGGLLDHAHIEGGVVGTFDTLYDSGEIVLDPGDRQDVVAAIPAAAAGVLTLWTEDYHRIGPGFAHVPTVPVAHFEVSGVAPSVFSIANGTPLREATADTVPVLGPATGHLLDPATFGQNGMSSEDIQLTNSAGTLGVDGKQGKHDPPGDYTTADEAESARWAEIGDTLELTVTNTTNAHHPFHLHGFSMQPLDLTKSGSPTYTFPLHEYRDNVDVPNGYTYRFRIKLEDRPHLDGVAMGGGLGRWVFHCHIFFHAEFGMISEFDVVKRQIRKPNINVIYQVLFVNPGDPVEIRGTYVDRLGLGLNLTASKGIVTDLGLRVIGAGGLAPVAPAGPAAPNTPGTFAWNYTAQAGDTGLVFLTATDADGNADQTAFSLVVNNPPVVTVDRAAGTEGAAIPIHATAVDPDGDPVTTTWSFAPAGPVDAGSACTIADPSALDTTIRCNDDGAYTLTLTASDGHSTVHQDATLVVANAPPSVSISTPVGGTKFELHDPATVVASFADAGTNDTHTCSIAWGDGATSPGVVAEAGGAGTCTSPAHTYATAGSRTIVATVTDDDGDAGSSSVTVVVYSAQSLKQDVLAQARALLAGANRRDAEELKEVVHELTEALDPRLWIDGDHLVNLRGRHNEHAEHGDHHEHRHALDGERVFEEEEDAVDELQEIVHSRRSAIPDATLQSMIDTLVQADRILATTAVNDAIAAHGNAHEIAEAQAEAATAALDVTRGRFESAIEHYELAWKEAQDSRR
ncbi:MAG: multicopper oxidase domain-containing protein [Acidobacteriia bacterium]|nr:multicopper oxidase domain-containing protein [Terriglobia bacterium]